MYRYTCGIGDGPSGVGPRIDIVPSRCCVITVILMHIRCILITEPNLYTLIIPPWVT